MSVRISGAPFWGCLLLLLVFLTMSESKLAESCPGFISSSCSCTDERSKSHAAATATAVRKRVACVGEDLTETPEPGLLPNQTVTLILSNNRIRVLRNASFSGLTALERLDLRGNLISTISPGAFFTLTSLRKLDLSNNRIGCLSPDMFQGLSNLTKLYLSGNIFSSLDPNVFQELPSLKFVNFNTELLMCDCGMRWVPGFLRSSAARLGEETLCAYPRILHNKPLRGLRESQLSCDGPLELHTLSLLPSLRQVVFKGDRLPFHCTAALVDKLTALHWRHNGQPVSKEPTRGVHLETSQLHDCTFITSELILSNVGVEASGEWECVVSTGRGNASRSVEIVVLENSASFCPEERITNNRGEFRWPRTLAGITSHQYCLQLRYPSPEQKRATRYCNRSGRWEEGDYTQCLYTNDITNVLYTFISMPLNVSNAVTVAHQVSPYTLEAAGFTDAIAVGYVAQMMQKFMTYVKQLRELSEVLVEMGSNLMQVDEQILWRAQREGGSCGAIVRSLESLAWAQLHSHAQDLSMNSRNIVMEAHLIRPAHFTGMSCTAYQRREGPGGGGVDGLDSTHEQQLRFRCTTGTHNTSLHAFPLKNAVALASISLPASLFSPDAPPDCKLQFVAFRSGRFFPFTGNASVSPDHARRRMVNTPVIYVGLDGCIMWNLSEPIAVALRHSSPGSDPVAVRWGPSAPGHHGSWSQDGCHLVHSDPSTSTLHCSLLGNYAVLQEVPDFPGPSAMPMEVLHPVVYACTAALLLCLFTVIITHILHHSSIRISRKSWHTLLNTCFHIAMTTAVFAGGITLTSYPIACQAVGIALHYSSLSTLLWIGVSARVLYKESVWRSPRQPDGESAVPPTQRPMLRFYLIAGGVPLIICGITAAVNVHNYGDNSPYCWLAWQPSLGAFFVPAGLALLVTWIYFLCTVARLRRRSFQKSKEPPCSAIVSSSSSPENQSALGGSAILLSTDSAAGAAGASMPVEDQYSLKVQFLVLVTTHFLFLALWVFGAMAMWQSGRRGVLFSCLYGITATALGVFLLVHHCVRRLDARTSWSGCCQGNRAPPPAPAYSHTCASTGVTQCSAPPQRGSQVFGGCHPPPPSDPNHYSSSARSSSSPSGTGSLGPPGPPGPCKLTNLLQVAQESNGSSGGSRPPPENNNGTAAKPANNLVPCLTASANTVPGHQRRKTNSRAKTAGAHHRGEGRGHFRMRALRGAGGGGSMGALGSTALELHPSHKHASSENGSLRNGSQSESLLGPLTNGRHGGEGLATSPSDGSDGGSSGGRKPFPLLPSVASRVAMQHGGQRRSASRDNLKLAAVSTASSERDSKRCSFPMNAAAETVTVTGTVTGNSPATPVTQNGTLKGSVIELDGSGTDQSQSSVGMRSGVWKSETTV